MHGWTCRHYLAGEEGGGDLGLIIFGNQEQRTDRRPEIRQGHHGSSIASSLDRRSPSRVITVACLGRPTGRGAADPKRCAFYIHYGGDVLAPLQVLPHQLLRRDAHVADLAVQADLLRLRLCWPRALVLKPISCSLEVRRCLVFHASQTSQCTFTSSGCACAGHELVLP